jgi:hypothetical protein
MSVNESVENKREQIVTIDKYSRQAENETVPDQLTIVVWKQFHFKRNLCMSFRMP